MQIACIHKQWEARSEHHAFFELAQELKQEEDFRRVAERARTTLTIVDNGAYEGKPMPFMELANMAKRLKKMGAKRIVMVAPDFPCQVFAHTLEAYILFRDHNPFPTMIVPQAPPGQLQMLRNAVRSCIEINADWIGMSIIACPAVEADRPSRPGFEGPEQLRRRFLDRVQVELYQAVTREINPIKVHLLGLGWDWWYAAGYGVRGIYNSIDSAKPARYAMLRKVMQEGMAHFNTPRDEELTREQLALCYVSVGAIHNKLMEGRCEDVAGPDLG